MDAMAERAPKRFRQLIPRMLLGSDLPFHWMALPVSEDFVVMITRGIARGPAGHEQAEPTWIIEFASFFHDGGLSMWDEMSPGK